MKLIFIYMVGIIFVHFANASESGTHSNEKIEENEDAHVLQESIELYGPPRSLNYENCNLPGPEVAVDDDRLSQKNFFKSDDSGNYTLKIRAITENFSYNDHYEQGENVIFGDKKIFTTKGQFTEIFQRQEGGYFLRTIGYVKDKRGYRLFLVDVSKITTERKKKDKSCVKRKRRSPIPPAALAALVGGGFGGGGGGVYRDNDC